MTDNQGLTAYQSLYAPLCNHVIQVESWSGGHDNYGKPVLDPSTSRQYKCLLQMNEQTRWGTQSATDEFPYMAYVLSVPIGQTDAVPIRAEEQVTVVSPAYWASDTPRRLGKIQTYFDQYGNTFVMVFAFE
jgi:hypothetical protein